MSPLKWIFPSLLLCGCAISPEPMNGPDGRPGYVMRCSGRGRTIEACYQKAGTLCPTGYDVIGQSTGNVLIGSSRGLLGASRQTLAIECK